VKHLYPLLRPGGCILSQDGHLRATHELLADEGFWQDVVGSEPPVIRGLGEVKLIEIGAP
jgi:hypothetical protein